MKPSASWAVPLTLGLALGWAAATLGPTPTRADPATPAAANPQEQALGAGLWMQTAAEYRACCLTVYQSAGDRLATIMPLVSTEPLKPAVVFDLDETVFDNSGFESFLYRERVPGKAIDATWDVWEKDYPTEVALVPGARAFIERAEKLGVTPVYISNRLETFAASTVAALRHNGLSTRDIQGRLFLRKPPDKDAKGPDTSNDKSSRRDAVAARYRVLMYFGDNLRDFAEWFAAPPGLRPDDNEGQAQAIRRRLAKVDEAAGHWGVDWYVLPNPVYGEWQKLLGDKPALKLRPTAMKLPAK